MLQPKLWQSNQCIKFKHVIEQLYESLRNERSKGRVEEGDWKMEVSLSEAKGPVAPGDRVPPDI